MIRLEPVTPDNWRVKLEVRPEQETFVAPKVAILARAWAYREMRSQAFLIYDGDTPVGIAMYHDYEDPEEGEFFYDFDQFLIDARYQGKGYGAEAVQKILALMEADGKYDEVVLCYIEGNEAARRLYEKAGFVPTGDVEEHEVIMKKRLR